MSNTASVEPSLDEVLGATSDEALLNLFASLTHQIHEASLADPGRSLREQRLIVQTEILFRMAARR